jgi:hypothetical protein
MDVHKEPETIEVGSVIAYLSFGLPVFCIN